ncbi:MULTISPECIES: RNA polymerase sigma factor [unclassified Sphingobium]|uniref:RNA polymerase sigma factor n=1 Tax=unclassified Sphingobium TaxID=2611147 RepID=UPI000D16C7FC|nr:MULTISPECIES: RNA polymerase sigma factor [unclassified Sphingobium]MBG6120243.1 RNA polymerase sigma-70 factor (ECF subfamily) [Sphingobium sp. JAI105]PSO09946.1 RNA polymerase subunit sigma-70 [Sphingobium sp. AEW4]TWD00103.1 RNA polymerase sigma-70 factor (ECF subfamily) [Sphingobium sp. AEW010]TWD19262.1 RNA polymerase sigma-70 factor (ECF subfamily) [Sphingobium sp. AEW013]TWD22073.1 RNA polymerase sigma-70 factor (ECF subfamily) [Sphingobium sp. AEW001]
MSEFEKGLEALLPRLRRFAHGLTANRADADDLTQVTVERALRARMQWQEGTRLDAWLYRIMRNCWIDTVRARSRTGKVLAPEEAGEHVGHDPTAQMDARIDLERLMQAMEKLPAEQREVVALVLVEGFGYRETAELLDLPIGTVSSRLVRGRTALLALVREV